MTVAEQEASLRYWVAWSDRAREECALSTSETLRGGLDESLYLSPVQASRPSPEDRVEFNPEYGVTNGDRRPIRHHALVQSPRRRMMGISLVDDSREKAAVYNERIWQGIIVVTGYRAHGALSTVLVGLPARSIQPG